MEAQSVYNKIVPSGQLHPSNNGSILYMPVQGFNDNPYGVIAPSIVKNAEDNKGKPISTDLRELEEVVGSEKSNHIDHMGVRTTITYLYAPKLKILNDVRLVPKHIYIYKIEDAYEKLSKKNGLLPKNNPFPNNNPCFLERVTLYHDYNQAVNNGHLKVPNYTQLNDLFMQFCNGSIDQNGKLALRALLDMDNFNPFLGLLLDYETQTKLSMMIIGNPKIDALSWMLRPSSTQDTPLCRVRKLSFKSHYNKIVYINVMHLVGFGYYIFDDDTSLKLPTSARNPNHDTIPGPGPTYTTVFPCFIDLIEYLHRTKQIMKSLMLLPSREENVELINKLPQSHTLLKSVKKNSNVPRIFRLLPTNISKIRQMLFKYALNANSIHNANTYVNKLTDTQTKQLLEIIARYEGFSENDTLEMMVILLLKNDINKHLLYLLSKLDVENGTKLILILSNSQENDITSILSLLYRYSMQYLKNNDTSEKLNKFISLLLHDDNIRYLQYILPILDIENGDKLLSILGNSGKNDITRILSLLYQYYMHYLKNNDKSKKLNDFISLLLHDNNKYLLYLVLKLDVENRKKLFLILVDLNPDDIILMSSILYEYYIEYLKENNRHHKISAFISLLDRLKQTGKKCNSGLFSRLKNLSSVNVKNRFTTTVKNKFPTVTNNKMVTRGGIRRYKTRRQRK